MTYIASKLITKVKHRLIYLITHAIFTVLDSSNHHSFVPLLTPRYFLLFISIIQRELMLFFSVCQVILNFILINFPSKITRECLMKFYHPSLGKPADLSIKPLSCMQIISMILKHESIKITVSMDM